MSSAAPTLLISAAAVALCYDPFLSSQPLVSVYTGPSSMVGTASDWPLQSVTPASPPPGAGASASYNATSGYWIASPPTPAVPYPAAPAAPATPLDRPRPTRLCPRLGLRLLPARRPRYPMVRRSCPLGSQRRPSTLDTTRLGRLRPTGFPRRLGLPLRSYLMVHLLVPCTGATTRLPMLLHYRCPIMLLLRRRSTLCTSSR